jgi:hypothetical protein
MAGMLTGDRPVRIEVMGLCQQQTSKRSNYTVTVPYPSMAKTIQTIGRMGGKVTGIQIGQLINNTVTVSPTSEESKAEAAPNGKGKGKKGR